jgi:hypothetical protein
VNSTLIPLIVVGIPAAAALLRDTIRLVFLWVVFRKAGSRGLVAAGNATKPFNRAVRRRNSGS